MTIWNWLRKIAGSGSDAKPGAASSHPAARPAKARPGKDDGITYAVNLSGFVIDQPHAKAFYQAAFADHPSRFVTNVDLRKHGDLLDKDALKALGLRANVKLSAQFLATLNERGRADPLEAASGISSAVTTALCTLRDLGHMEAAGVDLAKFRASNTEAGPCAAAAKLDGQNFPVTDAPLLPFETCSHADQCACFYQGWLAGLDD